MGNDYTIANLGDHTCRVPMGFGIGLHEIICIANGIAGSPTDVLAIISGKLVQSIENFMHQDDFLCFEINAGRQE